MSMPFSLIERIGRTSCSGRALSRRGWLDENVRPKQAGGMSWSPDAPSGQRFPSEIISHSVRPYHLFSLSLRDVELLLAERGVTAPHESTRR